MLSRRLTDLVAAGFFTKDEVCRGKQGRYTLTELDPATDDREAPLDDLDTQLDKLRAEHLG